MTRAIRRIMHRRLPEYGITAEELIRSNFYTARASSTNLAEFAYMRVMTSAFFPMSSFCILISIANVNEA